MSEIDWYQIAGEAWAKCDASLWGDDNQPDPTLVAAAALGPGLRAAVDAVLAAATARAERAAAAVQRVREELDHWEWDALGNTPVVQVDAIRSALDEPLP